MKLHSIVVLGRPNVGKSSLFNRILGRRHAIVDDKPGITRDRIYAVSDWNGRRFALIDTGGLLPHTDDPLLEAVKEQVQFAADEAYRILFLVDWETGVTDLDLDIAKYLQRLDKPVLTVINKADDDAREADFKDFERLGFGRPIPISAMRGRGIGDLLDQIIDFPITEDEPEIAGLRIAILGRPNVGKSSIVNALTGRNTMVVSEIPGTTRDAVDTQIQFNKNSITLVDTAGLRRRGRTKEAVEFYSTLRTAMAIQRSDVVWVVMDATVGLVSADQRIITDAYTAGKGILLLMNKWDLIEKDHRTTDSWSKQLKILLGEYGHLPIMFVSALKRQRLLKALETSQIIFEERSKRISTSQLNAKMLAIIEKTPPPAMRGKYINIKYMTQLSTTPPLFGIFCNHPQDISDSYRRFLERNLRQEFGFEGVPLRVAFKKKSKS
ncbi:MAG: ribosome biogenesis GTPase Der [bacterium]|nr:ribosome biogenesis GTPase Der [bacterium]